ncbi:MAG: aminotransferase class III-fold pyridoxal phosphate-dependent enzyme [Pseudomonadota bacterium]
MGVFSNPPPDFSAAKINELANVHFGIQGEVEPLVGERDQNARLITPDGRSYTIKIANTDESLALLDLQNAAMAHIAESGLRVPIPLTDEKNNPIVFVKNENHNSRHAFRILHYLDGVLFSSAEKSLELLESLGDFLGRISCSLQSFSHHESHRPDFLWNLDNCLSVKHYTDDITDPNAREMVESVFARYAKIIVPKLAPLRVAVIHGDVNDNNLLVGENNRVNGLFDFGDLCTGKQINELAIAMAYALMGQADIGVSSRTIIGAYVKHFPLQKDELDILFELIEMRLAQSICVSSHRARQFPENDYLLVSQEPALSLLRTLSAMNPQVKVCLARAAAGFKAVPNHQDICDWLRANSRSIGPVFEPDLHNQPRTVVSFSDGAEGSDLADDTDGYIRWLESKMQRESANFAIGLYAENRTCYKGDQFIVAGSSKPRSTHLGIDIFITAETPIYAPVAGRVYGVADNDIPYDYGGTVILEHLAGEHVFYSLYGHLSKSTVDLHQVGDTIEQGQLLGYIGAQNENGGWAPHLHFQLMTTMLGLRDNFNGAAEADRMDIWSQICPDPNLVLRFPPEAFGFSADQTDHLTQRRSATLPPSLSISYKNKLHIVRGRGTWLYDASGRRYLDCVNNICHVGHCHPHVVEALASQAGVLNTNTRYLHNTILDYAERLAGHFPDPLSVLYFVNSGTEANELALRIARTVTNRKDVIALDWGYHGNSNALIDVSAYKFARKGGQGAGEYTQIAELPDPFRGRLRGYSGDAGRGYADSIKTCIETIQNTGREGPATFIAEGISGCGGQIVFPDHYLNHAFEHVRSVGGLCIVDEVQTGFGRVGEAMWAFELQGVVPDIVTLGKPMGNGHPLAAVVTTAEIAKAFDNGMEFFSSFGGNPVSCAVGMAVLDVIEQENLREQARATSQSLLAELNAMKVDFETIGDIRGYGLFLGIELVEDHETLKPATATANAIINRMRDKSVLLSTDGPHDNVLKFKPPMSFGESESAMLIDTLRQTMAELSC